MEKRVRHRRSRPHRRSKSCQYDSARSTHTTVIFAQRSTSRTTKRACGLLVNEYVSLFTETRGLLGVTEFSQLPFLPKRMFWITSVPPGASRAGHAHRTCSQLLIGLSGSIVARVTPQNGSPADTRLGVGNSLLIPPRHWLVLSNFSADSVLGVLASEPYSPHEYVTDYVEFENLRSP
jgi:WxcM-like, C-terminal